MQDEQNLNDLYNSLRIRENARTPLNLHEYKISLMLAQKFIKIVKHQTYYVAQNFDKRWDIHSLGGHGLDGIFRSIVSNGLNNKLIIISRYDNCDIDFNNRPGIDDVISL